MSYTVQNIVDQAMASYGTLSSANALIYAQDVWDEITFDLRVLQDDRDISLVAGTPEYSLTGLFIRRIYSATYYLNATQSWELRAVQKRSLDLSSPGFRVQANSDPSRFYSETKEDGTGVMAVGLDPKPPTTTSGGYPILKIWAAKNSTLALATVLPDAIDSMQPILSGIRAKHAYAERLAGWEKEAKFFEEQKSALQFRLQTVAPDAPPEIAPAFRQLGRRH